MATIYPSNFEQRIGFDRIRSQVADCCSMHSARECIAAEGFLRSRREVEERLGLANQLQNLYLLRHPSHTQGYQLPT